MSEHRPQSDDRNRDDSLDEISIVEDAAAPSPEDERVAELIAHTIDVPVLASAVEQQEAADAADILEDLEDEDAAEVLHEMADEAAAEALAEMEIPLAEGIIEDLLDEERRDYAARLFYLMAPDDAADILQALDDDLREDLLIAIPLDKSIGLRRLIGYDEDTAGGMMTTDFVALDKNITVGEAIEIIRGRDLAEGVNDLPIIDASRKLMGLIGLRDLLLNEPGRRIDDLMTHSIRVLRPDMDREQVAHEFDRYDHAMMPVVEPPDPFPGLKKEDGSIDGSSSGGGGRLLGIITFDDVIDIIRHEQTEDVQKTVGAGAEEAVYSSITEKFRGRFPWLGISLVMTCAAAMIVLFFEDLIRDRTILAFLLPVIAALVGNAGHQALAVTLRGIVLDQIRPDRVGPLFLREGLVGLMNGALLGLLIMLATVLIGSINHNLGAGWEVGIMAALALTCSMTVGTLVGSGIPLTMKKLGFDPAQASAIFLIMITDAMAFSMLLLMTWIFL